MKMNRQWIMFYLLVTCTHLSHQSSVSNSSSYKAAVVTYNSIYIPNNIKSTLDQNCKNYIEYIERAQIKDVDIIVFPEYGLTSINLLTINDIHNWTIKIPSPIDNCIPCTQRNEEIDITLIKISCAAKQNRIYVVINIPEKIYLFEKKKTVYYSSNVVFDRKGRIIAKYRKMHLSGTESQLFNVPSMIQNEAIFNTDFGVKFATFTSYDLLFYEPALRMTRIEQITDIVHPTAWFSGVPFLTALQIEAGWSFSENVNLLTSNYNRPTFGNIGGGVYLGRKGISKAILSNSETLLTTCDVPKINKNKLGSSNFHLYYRDVVHDFTKQKIRLQKSNMHEDKLNNLCNNQKNISEEYDIFLYREFYPRFLTIPLNKTVLNEYYCVTDFCCMFEGEIERIDPCTTYHIVIFKEYQAILDVEGGVLTCSIMQCLSSSSNSCVSMEKSKTLFKNLRILAKFNSTDKNLLIMPSTLNSNLFPLNFTWTYSENVSKNIFKNGTFVTIFTDRVDDIVTFGIYARNFSADKII